MKKTLVVLFVSTALSAGRIGFAGDAVEPGRVVTDPPTLENLGFRWLIEGDDNRNASVTVSYRKPGASDWRTALPMLRTHMLAA